jgi:hypothetical protein
MADNTSMVTETSSRQDHDHRERESDRSQRQGAQLTDKTDFQHRHQDAAGNTRHHRGGQFKQ